MPSRKVSAIMREQEGSEQQQRAKADKLPARFKAAEAVARRQTLRGSLPVSQLSRLGEALSGSAGALQVELSFDRYPRAVGRVHGRIRGLLPLTCQRTLEVFFWPLDAAFEWVMVRSEAEEERLLADADPLILEDDQLKLHEAIEDEVLLALPLVPLSPDSRPPSSADAPATAADEGKALGKSRAGKTKPGRVSHNVELDDSRPNPFAALKGKFNKN